MIPKLINGNSYIIDVYKNGNTRTHTRVQNTNTYARTHNHTEYIIPTRARVRTHTDWVRANKQTHKLLVNEVVQQRHVISCIYTDTDRQIDRETDRQRDR